MPRTLSPNAGLRVLSPDEFVYNADDPTYSGAGEFSKAVTSAGIAEDANRLATEAAKAMVAGDVELGRRLDAQAKELYQRAAAWAPRVQQASDIRGAGDFVDWAAGATGSGLRSSLRPALGGLAGGVLGALSPIPGGAAIGASLGSGITGYNVGTDENVGNAMMDPELRAKGDYAGMLREGRKTGALQGVTEGLFGAAGGLGSAVMGTERRILAKALAEATAAKGGAALTKREVADISTRLLRERVAEDGAAKFMAKHTLPEMGGEGFTEGVQNIQGQQMMQNLKGTDEGYDWSSALNDAAAGALPGGAMALPGGAALVARSRIGQGVETVRRDPVGVIADGISGASSLAGTGAARLSDWAARATSEPLRAHDALVNDGALSDADAHGRAVQWAEHVLNNAREFSADERTDAQRFIQNMNDPAALTAYRDKLTFDHHGAIGDAASDDLVSELGGQTGQSKASRMEASPVAPEDVISGGADITAAYERARAQQSRDDVAEILRKQGVAEKLLGSLAGASEDKQRAALSSVLGWMQSGFKGSGDKVFMPRTLINAFGKGTESLLNRMADTALLHGVIKPEVRDQLPAVIDIARKLHAEETSVDDAVFGNMIGDAAKAFRPIRKEFIPEMRRMAQNGTTKAEEDFLLRLYGSKERIAAAMSKFAEDRKDIRLETQGVATEDEEGNVEGDYEGGTEVVPGQTKVSYIGHGANKDRPYNTLYADKKAELATLLSTLHNEHGLFHHQIGAWKALKEQWGSNPEVLRQKEDEALLDSERKRSWTSDDDANYLSTLDGMDEERRLSLLKAYDESHKLVKVTETVSESTPDTITPEQVESFREKSLRVKDAAGNWVDNNTPENRRLFLERETSVNEDTGEVTGKNEAFLTSTLRLMKHVWRSQEEGQTNAGKRKGALAEYDAFMRGLAALIQSDGSFTGRIGFQTEPGGDVRWMRIDAVRKKGNVSAMKLPRNLRLSKSTVNDALAQQKTEALAGGKMNAELTDVSSEPGDQIFSDTDKDIVPSESTSDEARSFTSLREGPTGEIYRDAHGVAQGLGGDAEGLSVVGTGGAGTRPVARREKGEKIAALTQAELDRNEQRKKEGLEPVYPAVRRGNFASRKSEHATDSAGSPRATKRTERTERAVEPVTQSQLSALDKLETARDWVVETLRAGTPVLLDKIKTMSDAQLKVVRRAIFGRDTSTTAETYKTVQEGVDAKGRPIRKRGSEGLKWALQPAGEHTTTSHAAGLVDLVGDQLGKLYFKDAPERGRMLSSRLKAGAERIAQAIDARQEEIDNGQAEVQPRHAATDEGARQAPAQGNTDAGGREAGVAARDQGRRNAGQSPVVASGQGRKSEVKTWARAAENGYEVSTAGDKRFSALNARLKDGRTIEEAYQLDVKGFRKYSNDWRIGKGKKPLDRSINRYAEYKKLWQQWAAENPGYISELRKRSEGKVLTDKFASTDVSQARALAEILNEQGEASGQGRKSEVAGESLRDTAKARFAEAKTPRDKINFLFDELKGLLDQTDMTSSFGHTFTYNKKTQPELELAQYLEYLSDAVRNLGNSMTPKQSTALGEMVVKAYRAFQVWAGGRHVADVIEAGEVPAAKYSRVVLPAVSHYVSKDQAKSDKATKFIGQGSPRSSTAAYAKAWGERANSGTYSASDTVFVSAEGGRSGRVAADAAELARATDAGATILTDDKSNRERAYNVGEREVVALLTKAKYVEVEPGVWKPASKQSKVTSLSDARFEKTKQRAIDLANSLSEEDYNTLQNDVMSFDFSKSLVPSSMEGSFFDWLRDNYNPVEREDKMAHENIRATEEAFLEETAEYGEGVEQAMAAHILSGGGMRLANTQPAGVRTRQATQEEVDAAVEHITKTLGDSVALDFKKFFGDNTSGRWTPRKVKNLIEIALNSDVLGTAYHESMHEFFAMLGEHGGEAVQALLTRVATNKIVLNQLYKRLADHKGAIEQLSNKEEALAFMYQFSLADPSFKLGPETKTLFQKIRQFFAKVFNRVSAETKDAEMADRILAGFTRGEFKDTGTREALIKALNANVEAHNKALESRGKVVQTLIDTFGKAVFSNEAMMELTKNPFMVAIIRKANQKAGEAMGEKAAYFDALHSATGQWMNRLENILRQAGGDKEVLEIARKALATGKPTHHPVASNIVKEIRAFNDAMHAYMTTRGVMRYDPEAENAKWGTKGDWVKVPFRKDYFPQAWDVDALMKNADAFKKLLLTHNMKALEAIAANANAELARVDSAKDAGTRRAAEKALGPAAKEMHDSGARQTVTPELVADALYARLLNANGHGDLQESTSNVGMSPAASAVNRRELDFIEHPDFDAFKEKDLVKIMTGYTRGMVKRAEYTHVFGPGGEGLSELADKAMLHELGGEKLIKAAEDGMAPAVEQWKKEKAAAIAAGEEFTKPFPTLRSVGQAQHFATVGREQGVADLKAATGKLANGYQAIMALEGTLGADITPQGRLLNSMLITYQSLRTLSTALFGSMNDVMGIVVNGGELGDAWDAFTKGVREIGLSWKGQKSADDAARRAELFGTIEATVALDALGETYGSMWQSGRMKKVSDNFFKWNGMEGWNRAMRITATAVAERQILDYKQNGYDKNDPAAVARFERLFGKGFDPANIAVDADGRVDVSDAKNQAAVMRWVSDAVMLPNASHRPIPASDPHFATFYHLKQFSYTMHRVMLKNAMEQAKLGNYRPAMVLVTGYAPVMIAADAAKELMIPGDEPPWMKNGIGAYLRHGIERAGLGGVPQMYLSNVIDFDPAALFGPTVDQVQNMASIPFMEKHTVTKEGLGALPGGNVLRRAG